MYTADSSMKFVREMLPDIRVRLGLDPDDVFDVGVLLGSGWFSSESWRGVCRVGLMTFNPFREVHGRRLELVIGWLGDVRVVGLLDRGDMNEAPNEPLVPVIVRTQVELLLALGIRRLVVTGSAGAVKSEYLVGDLALIRGFVSESTEGMPLWRVEEKHREAPRGRLHPSRELDRPLRVAVQGVFTSETAGAMSRQAYTREGAEGERAPGRDRTIHSVVLMFHLGPHLEGLTHDRRYQSHRGAGVISNDIKPPVLVGGAWNRRVGPAGYVQVVAAVIVTSDHRRSRSETSSSEVAGGYLAANHAFLDHLVQHPIPERKVPSEEDEE